MGRMKDVSISLMELEDPHNEFGTLDFDHGFSDDSEWWKQQDAELTAAELKQIESDAEIFDYRINGYE